MESASLVCPTCSLPILSEFYFCPNCGKQLRIKEISLSVGKILGICLLSFFLPPFGLFHAFKYIRQSNTKTKFVGWSAVGLTIVAYILGIFSFMNIMRQLSNTYGTLLQ